MNEKQERLLRFVRTLHERDGHGPEAFPIHRPKLDLEELLKFEPTAAQLKGIHLETRKRAESFARGLDARASIALPVRKPGGQRAAPTGPVLTEEAARAYDRALTNQPLTKADFIHLESIVLPALRPAFDILNESYETLPASWKPLNDQRSKLEPLIRGVGRLQLTGHPSYTLVGTGFVCGPKAILTNRHVAQVFVQGIESGMQLSFLPDVTCALEMRAEVGSAESVQLNVVKPVTVSTRWDLALFAVESLPDKVTPLPLASSAPNSLDGGYSTIVGYPSYDSEESLVDQINIFRTVFDRKRLQPGKLNGRAEVLSFGHTVSAVAHDCSTLGGNSGSALIAVEEAKVVGIHFAGLTHVSNYAVPAWELANDPALQGEELSFG